MKRFLLLIIDITAFYAGLYITLFIRYGGDLSRQMSLHLSPFTTILIIWLAVFYIANLYDLIYLKNNLAFSIRYWQAIGISAALSIIFFYLAPSAGITPKTNLLIFTVIFSALNFLVRLLFNQLITAQGLKNNTIIVGFNQQALDAADFIKANPQMGYVMRYLVDLDSSAPLSVPYKIIKEEDLERVIRDEKIRTVVISPSAYKSQEVIATLYRNLHKKINFFNLPYFYEINTGKVPLDAIDQTWFLTNLTEGKKNLFGAVKRVSDIVLALILGLLSVALFPLIVSIVKRKSPGPIFYRQIRVGRYGKKFMILKFRTMHLNAEQQGAVWAKENDPRISPSGRWLRKFRLDELPQFWNILKGDMSFVGPRAERPEFDEKLKGEIPFYEERYLVRPGLSGWAQVQYKYGSSVKDAREKLQYDLFYIKHRTFILDTAILLRTLNIIFRQAGR